MVAYNLLLSRLPGRADRAVRRRPGALQPPSSSARSSPTCSSSSPTAAETTLSDALRQRPRVLDDRRASSPSSRASGSAPRSGARSTPRSAASTSCPCRTLGAPEAVRPRDARPRPAVLRRHRRDAGRAGAARLASRPTCRSASPSRDALYTITLGVGFVIAVRRALRRSTAPSRTRRMPVARRLAGRARRDDRDRRRRLRLPALPAQRQRRFAAAARRSCSS